MEEVPSTGRSILREKVDGSTHSLGGRSTSFLSLRGHAAPIAGTGSTGAQPGSDPFARTTPAGITLDVPAHQSEADALQPEDQPADTDAVVTPVAAPKPLSKRRWFIITSVVGACLGIALLFIILFPVLRAIVQYVINQSILNIQRAAKLSLSNTSFTLTMQGVIGCLRCIVIMWWRSVPGVSHRCFLRNRSLLAASQRELDERQRRSTSRLHVAFDPVRFQQTSNDQRYHDVLHHGSKRLWPLHELNDHFAKFHMEITEF